MLTNQDLLNALSSGPSNQPLVIHNDVVGDLDLRARIIDRRIVFIRVRFQRGIDCSQTTFRDLATFADCEFSNSARFVDARFEHGAHFSGSVFSSEADFFRAQFGGTVRFWNARFRGPATFKECEVRPPAPDTREDGVAEFSWSRFEGKAIFTYMKFFGDVNFYRSIFQGDALFDECTFSKHVTFAGNPTEILFPRVGVIDPGRVAELERLGFWTPDTEQEEEVQGQRLSRYMFCRTAWSVEQLRERLDELKVPLSPRERLAIERTWQHGARRMFAPDSLVSFRHATFEQIASLEFQKVDFTDVSLDGAVAGPPDVVAAFSSATTSNTFDVFLSHSSEDKDTFVRPLVAALRTMGQRVWYDEQGISIGGSLRQSIDAGLARSHYGVVIFSPSFFARPWTQYELDAFVAAPGRVLPIWFNVGRDDVAKHSKDWADILALKAQDYPIDRLAAALVKAMKPSEHVGALETEKKQLQAELRKLRDENRRLRLENQSLQVGTPTFVSAAASAD